MLAFSKDNLYFNYNQTRQEHPLFSQARIYSLSDRMQEQMEATGGLEADAKFLFELSVKEYAGLSENKEKELWDRYYAQESKRLDEIEEADIGD